MQIAVQLITSKLKLHSIKLKLRKQMSLFKSCIELRCKLIECRNQQMNLVVRTLASCVSASIRFDRKSLMSSTFSRSLRSVSHVSK